MSKNSSGVKLVVVESPTKAKTIRKFLGKDFIVESCMGHIRDLPQSAKDIPEKFKKEKWAQLGVNVDKNFEPLYTIPKDKTKVVKNLKDSLAEADELYLATDEDREGESISWHLVEVLKPGVPVKRMVFNEITREAILKALKDTRTIDMNLVKAQEARRILDRLVGYTISPLIWKKIAYGLSAGRVQSVAVRLIVERELERLRFKKSSYWGVEATLDKSGQKFKSRLLELQGLRLAQGKDFSAETGKLETKDKVILLDEQKAKDVVQKLRGSQLTVDSIEEKTVHRKPAAPFITSTLQQESNRKLGLSSRETMQVAQKLYEQGFITYMRTDSTFLSQEAIDASRAAIQQKYGKEYLPGQPRSYEGKKAKGAQEAHEAIRPAGGRFQDPAETGLSGLQFKLYEMIWMRTIASQMVDSEQKQVSVRFTHNDAIFTASGQTIVFPGFLRAYVEGSDDPEAELSERESLLPPLKKGEKVACPEALPTFHETKPPARFTEASLVQTMEKEGIGRPSTYASIIGTIIDRGYVRKNGTALTPTFTALVVSNLLSKYLPEYVDLGFTSEMEQSLDKVAEGDLDSEKYLKQVYFGPQGLQKQVTDQEKKINPDEARSIQLQGLDGFKFHVGRYGAYLTTKKDGQDVSASLPDAEAPADITSDRAMELIDQKINGADSIGKDPKTGQSIYVLNGRYGPYVQLGEVTPESDKPKRASLPPGTTIEQVTLEKALFLLSLPRVLGQHPESKEDIKLGLGRFGPFIQIQKEYRSVPKTMSFFDMNLQQALELIKIPKKSRRGSSALKVIGKHPQSGEEVQLFDGPYGLYIKHGKTNASLAQGQTAESITLEQALELLKNKEDLAPSKPAKAKKAAPKKKASAAKAKAEAAPVAAPPVKKAPATKIRRASS